MFENLRNRSGERLDASFHPGTSDSRDLLVIGHGVTANKDRPFLVALAEAAADAGLAALRVSFAGNGESEGRFEEATISKEVEDLACVLDACSGRRVVYAGHSMGAAVGVTLASRDHRIAGLLSLAGMVHTEKFARRKFGGQEPGASFMWDKPDCPLSVAYMEDMAAIGSVVELGVQISVPWLLVHGVEDTVVPIQDAKDIVQQAPQSELVTLSECDHVFSDTATEAMLAAVLRWLGAWGQVSVE